MKRNKFNLSHYKLFTGDMGYLIPISWYSVIPGDTVQQYTSLLLRLSPMLAPIMHPVRIRIHSWFVGLLQIWDDFDSFITGGEDGLDATVHPYYDLNASDLSGQESQLIDYLGIPPIDYTGQGTKVSALPSRVYNKIFNDCYRDQDLVTAANLSTSSGSDLTTDNTLRSVCWEKDYFTTARTSQQKGSDIIIPFSDDTPLPIKGIGNVNQAWNTTSPTVYESDGTSRSYPFYHTDDGTYVMEGTAASGGYPKINVDLSGIGINIDDMRLSYALQQFQEARQRYGGRYSEYLSYLGITPNDRSLNRPVYLGGGSKTVSVSEVLVHSDDGDPVGDMKGHGISALRSRKFRKFFNEHGIVMTLMSVLPVHMETQGLFKEFLKTTNEEYFQRELQNVGDQPILNDEVYAKTASPGDTFGYQDQYDEYRSLPNQIAGEFRSSLDHWHMANIHAAEPSLNSSFVTATPTKRVFASQSTDVLYCMAHQNVVARRPIRRRK